MRKQTAKIIRHLKDDIKGYRREAGEDKALIKDLKKGEPKMPRKKQGYNARLDESLGMRHPGKKKQSLKDRRDESKAMEKHYGMRPYSSVKTMDKGSRKKK